MVSCSFQLKLSESNVFGLDTFNAGSSELLYIGNADENTVSHSIFKINKSLMRPAEVNTLLADFSKAKRKLKWKPKISFKRLVEDMVDSDMDFVSRSGY